MIEMLFQGVTSPRASMRWLLGRGITEQQRLIMVLAATCAGLAIQYAMLPFAHESVQQSVPVQATPESIIKMVAVQFLIYGVGSLLICQGARIFGGQGSFADTRSALAWWSLVTTLLVPFQLLSLLVPSAAVLTFAVLLFAFWLLANYVSEVHGFGNVFLTALAMFGGFLFTMTIVVTLLGAVGIIDMEALKAVSSAGQGPQQP